jgi:hypothetical protein
VSKGGLILMNALAYLTPDEKSRLWVTTYGSAKVISGKGLYSCRNYISFGDPITMIADPINYFATRLGYRSNVEFFESKSFMEHSFEKAYGGVRNIDSAYFEKHIKEKYSSL